jgi:hypothetical protein
MKINALGKVSLLLATLLIGIAQIANPQFSPLNNNPPSRPGFVSDTDITLPDLFKMPAFHFDQVQIGPIKADETIVNAFVVATTKDSNFKYYAMISPFKRVYSRDHSPTSPPKA